MLEVKYDQDPKSKLPVKVVKSDLKVESSEGTILFDREEGHSRKRQATGSGSRAT